MPAPTLCKASTLLDSIKRDVCKKQTNQAPLWSPFIKESRVDACLKRFPQSKWYLTRSFNFDRQGIVVYPVEALFDVQFENFLTETLESWGSRQA